MMTISKKEARTKWFESFRKLNIEKEEWKIEKERADYYVKRICIGFIMFIAAAWVVQRFLNA